MRNPFQFYQPRYANCTRLRYSKYINGLIADAQITNGGPVILYQPENEYFYRKNRANPVPPDQDYIAKVIKQARDAGIVIPLHSNDGDEADISRVLRPSTGEVDMLVCRDICMNPSMNWMLTKPSRAMMPILLLLIVYVLALYKGLRRKRR